LHEKKAQLFRPGTARPMHIKPEKMRFYHFESNYLHEN